MRRFKIVGYGSDKGRCEIKFGKETRFRVDHQQSHYTLAKKAIEEALYKADLRMEDIDLLVYAGAIDIQPIPCSAALISAHIKTKKPIPCMDINATCNSFIAALDTISYMVESKRYERCMIVTIDLASAGLNPDQKESFELFSDASTAVIIQATDHENGAVYGLQRTWSKGVHDTEIRGGLMQLPSYKYDLANKADYLFDMKGPRVLRLVVKSLPEFVRVFEEESGYLLTDMDLIIPHQASRALSLVMKRLGIVKEKYIDEVAAYGNMIASSIPFMLIKAIKEKRIEPGDKVLLFGTAAGLTISGLILQF